MPEPDLTDRRILIAEDEYLLAQELRDRLEDSGAVVLGPAATLAQTLAIIAGDRAIDAAVMDVNLRGEKIFPAVEMLLSRGVPVVLTTGYDRAEIPARFGHVPRCDKPADMRQIVRAIGRALEVRV